MEQLFCIFVESKYKKGLQDHDALDPQDFLEDLDSVALGGLDSDALGDLDSIVAGDVDSGVSGDLESDEQLDGLLEDINPNQKLRN